MTKYKNEFILNIMIFVFYGTIFSGFWSKNWQDKYFTNITDFKKFK